MDKLERLRREINTTDATILQMLAKRRELSRQVIEDKAISGRPLRDEKREEELLARLIAEGRDLGLDAHHVTRIFHEVIDDSVRCQQLYLLEGSQPQTDEKKVAYQGIAGAYSHLAAQKFFAREKTSPVYVGYPTFQEVVTAVETGETDFALLPIENTTAGSINEVYDLLSSADLHILGEEIFPVEHCLLAIEDVPLSKIRRILSHPQGLAQCVRFLSTLENCQREYYADTAMAVRKVKEDNDLSQAAIASEEAGRLYGLKVLKRHLADQPNNYTRFLVVSTTNHTVDTRIPCKTSLVLATRDEEGALLRSLTLLHEHRLNLTKLESRPRPGYPFQYLFYLDFVGNLSDPNVAAAVDRLRDVTAFLKILGSYPIEQRRRTAPRLEDIVPPSKPQVTQAHNSAEGQATPETEPTALQPPRRLAERGARSTDTAVGIGETIFGGDEFAVIGGPRHIKSQEKILTQARELREAGGKVFLAQKYIADAGPGTRSELSSEILEQVVEACSQYDVAVVADISSPARVQAVARAVDALLVAGHNMQNAELLRAAGKSSRPVILQRRVTATVDELLSAAEAILAQGNHQIILCECGRRVYDSAGHGVTVDLASIPSLRARTHLPVVIDPRGVIDRSHLHAIAEAGRLVGAHGILLAVDSDGNDDAIDLGAFTNIVRTLYLGAGK